MPNSNCASGAVCITWALTHERMSDNSHDMATFESFEAKTSKISVSIHCMVWLSIGPKDANLLID